MTTNNRVVVLLSGNGSNLQALLDQQTNYSYEIVGVVCNRPNAYGLERAKSANIPALMLDHKAFSSRENYDSELIEIINNFNPKLVVLAGYMRILTALFVKKFQNRLMNIHPSLLPKYKGLHTHRRVLEEQQVSHGTTVHFVNEAVDDGAIIVQASLNIGTEDTEQSLYSRVQKMEHQIYPMAVDWFTSNRLHHKNEQLMLDNTYLGNKGYQLQEQHLINEL